MTPPSYIISLPYARVNWPAGINCNLFCMNGLYATPDFLKTLRSAGISLALSDFRGPDGFERKTFPHVGDYLDNPAEVVTGSVAYVRLIGDRRDP